MLTPLLVRRIRLWLFGDATDSYKYLSDYAMMSMIMTACAAMNVSLTPTTGYFFSPKKNELAAQGHNVTDLPDYVISFVEHAINVATGHFSTLDHVFQPYDPRPAKERWGKSLIAKLRTRGTTMGLENFEPVEIWDLLKSGRLRAVDVQDDDDDDDDDMDV
jgi:hypothetical protein